jgi:hypothetical protein
MATVTLNLRAFHYCAIPSWCVSRNRVDGVLPCDRHRCETEAEIPQ